MSFDKSRFEGMMSQGVKLQAAGDHEAALDIRREAMFFAQTDDTLLEHGRAARDMSASYDRMGRPKDALTMASTALSLHKGALLRTEGYAELREFSASTMQLGSLMLSGAILSELEQGSDTASEMGEEALGVLVEALDCIHGENEDSIPVVDQYEVNMMRRVSIAESLYGDKKGGFILGANAVFLGLLSESPSFVQNTEPSLTLLEKMRAKAKGVVGGLGAVGVAAIEYLPGGKVGRKVSLKLAKKVL